MLKAVRVLGLACVAACGIDGMPAEPAEEFPEPECSDSVVVANKRVVRLTFNQQANAIQQLFGPAVAAEVRSTFDIDATDRTFPPLANAREGSVVTDGHFLTGDNIAQFIGQHVHDHFAEVTGCAAGDDACSRSYLMNLAERAFRRPLDAADQTGLLGVYTGMMGEGGQVAEALQYGVYAVLSSPYFNYRTEFGDDPAADGPLTDAEFASALSFFVADAPPDEELLAAAGAGELDTAEGITAQVYRMLRTAPVQRNLEAAMFAYFQIGTLDSVVIDPLRAPDFDQGLRNSMYRESQLFIRNVLWPGKLTGLLTSRKTLVNDRVAALYGIPFPPAGATLDGDGFAMVELPDNRAGLMTMPGFLTARSRPDQPSVVGRGLAINAAFLCVQNPPFPENLSETIDEVSQSLEGKTERDKADYRMETAPCNGCHTAFDPYGLALERFDIIGKYRELDEMGRPIDASVTLPTQAGGATVQDARVMAEELAQSDAFVQCMAKNVLAYALAEGGVALESCATRQLVKRFRAGDGSFASLVSEVAAAESFRLRASGGTSP
jgi:hypothetical protein